MKQFKNLVLAGTLLLVSISCSAKNGEDDGSKVSDFSTKTAEIWRAQKGYALSLIDQMPESKLDFSPADSTRSFAQLFKHIGTSSLILKTVFSQEPLPPIFPKLGEAEAIPMDKSELKAYVSSKYDEAIATFENLTDKQLDQTYTFYFFPGQPPVKDFREVITALGAHIVHHRGQATIYLRMNGIKPVQYTHYW
ncbi:DinB family protein [Reichenbachiella sp.]|uniref:DinB family protein n=1 Tax=Reichenbachiella sp. TaxID=2184521 RepID=UPI0032967CD8